MCSPVKNGRDTDENAAGEGPSGNSPAATVESIFDNLVLGKSCTETAMSVEQSSDRAVSVLSVRALEEQKRIVTDP